MRSTWLIARSVLIEAVRRREIYAIVLVSLLVIGAVMTVDFFKLEGLEKFYREIALQIMSTATALTVIVLAARQLPREFEMRTIYPLLAKPVGRAGFLLGKLLGVLLAAAFCYAMFMAVYLAGAVYLKSKIPWMLFAQYVYLQMLMMLVVATLGFWLSMLMNFDAAITIGALLYVTANTLSTMIVYIYDQLGFVGQKVMVGMLYVIPQLTLFDLSDKAVHAEKWGPIGAVDMAKLTAYGLAYAALYFGFTMISFRRRPL